MRQDQEQLNSEIEELRTQINAKEQEKEETVEKIREEHKEAIEEKDTQIRELRGSRGKIQLMFALSIKVRQMFQRILAEEQAAQAQKEQDMRGSVAQAIQKTEVEEEMASYF